MSFFAKICLWPDLTRSNVDLGLKTICAIARSRRDASTIFFREAQRPSRADRQGGRTNPPPPLLWRRWRNTENGWGLRSIWFYVSMKQKWIWNLSLCYFSLFCIYSYRLWWPNCWEEKWFNLAHVIQTMFEDVLIPLTNQLANSRDAIPRHLYYKVFK